MYLLVLLYVIISLFLLVVVAVNISSRLFVSASFIDCGAFFSLSMSKEKLFHLLFDLLHKLSIVLTCSLP
jgi:hypothetical protein